MRGGPPPLKNRKRNPPGLNYFLRRERGPNRTPTPGLLLIPGAVGNFLAEPRLPRTYLIAISACTSRKNRPPPQGGVHLLQESPNPHPGGPHHGQDKGGGRGGGVGGAWEPTYPEVPNFWPPTQALRAGVGVPPTSGGPSCHESWEHGGPPPLIRGARRYFYFWVTEQPAATGPEGGFKKRVQGNNISGGGTISTSGKITSGEVHSRGGGSNLEPPCCYYYFFGRLRRGGSYSTPAPAGLTHGVGAIMA